MAILARNWGNNGDNGDGDDGEADDESENGVDTGNLMMMVMEVMMNVVMSMSFLEFSLRYASGGRFSDLSYI